MLNSSITKSWTRIQQFFVNSIRSHRSQTRDFRKMKYGAMLTVCILQQFAGCRAAQEEVQPTRKWAQRSLNDVVDKMDFENLCNYYKPMPKRIIFLQKWMDRFGQALKSEKDGRISKIANDLNILNRFSVITRSFYRELLQPAAANADRHLWDQLIKEREKYLSEHSGNISDFWERQFCAIAHLNRLGEAMLDYEPKDRTSPRFKLEFTKGYRKMLFEVILNEQISQNLIKNDTTVASDYLDKHIGIGLEYWCDDDSSLSELEGLDYSIPENSKAFLHKDALKIFADLPSVGPPHFAADDKELTRFQPNGALRLGNPVLMYFSPKYDPYAQMEDSSQPTAFHQEQMDPTGTPKGGERSLSKIPEKGTDLALHEVGDTRGKDWLQTVQKQFELLECDKDTVEKVLEVLHKVRPDKKNLIKMEHFVKTTEQYCEKYKDAKRGKIEIPRATALKDTEFPQKINAKIECYNDIITGGKIILGMKKNARKKRRKRLRKSQPVLTLEPKLHLSGNNSGTEPSSNTNNSEKTGSSNGNGSGSDKDQNLK